MIVVTGAAGHIGNNLVRALIVAGEQVRCLVLPTDGLRPLAGLPVERVPGDVRDRASLDRAFQGARVVYHLASLVSIVPGRETLLQAVNVAGARNVAVSCLRAGVGRLVHVSSIHALSEAPPGTVLDEARPFDPAAILTAYGRSKARGTLEVLALVEQGLDAVVVCPTGVIGPHDYQPSAMGQLFLDFARGRLLAYVEGAYDFVDVRDVAAGLMAAAARARPGRTYILSGERITVREILATLAGLTGMRAPRLCLPRRVAYAAAFAAGWYHRLTGTRALLTRDSIDTLHGNSRISHARAARELGFRPRPIRQSMADTVAWFRTVGALG